MLYSDGNLERIESGNILLFIGMGLIGIGLVTMVVGLGEKGFKTIELKLIGPSLVGCGMFFTLLRILFFTIPAICSSCFKCCRRKEDTNKLLEEEKDAEENMEITMKTAVKRNGLLKPMRDTVTNERRRTVIGHGVGQQAIFISEDEEQEERKARTSTRPQLRPNRQGISMRRHDEDNFSDSSSSTFSLADLGDVGPELIPHPPHLGRSTKDIRMGEIILNTNIL